ncbi:hypothetical protein GCM10007170_08500 [Arthrobacter liuii]|uniref:Uncharacterized protein n=1 Tax=Arthrobacter liuii TaxID=1476996 RepID=A0ABQ2AHQ1_9MICC|nr:hypothetical protein GCM10007170_08500 [Arthrobacter liuii]
MQETLRPTQVLYQGNGTGTHCCQGAQPGIAAKRGTAGQLPAEAQEGRPSCHSAKEEVDGNVIAPRRRLHHGAPVIRGEFRFRNHGHFPPAVTVLPAASRTAFTAIRTTTARGLRWPEAVEF